MTAVLPRRRGSRPRTTPTNPHTQLDQQPTDLTFVTELRRRAFSLPDVEERPSAISVPGARALWLQTGAPTGPRTAFMVGREFAHFHPAPDHSLHLTLPPDRVEAVIERGWGEMHPVARMGFIPATAVMVYAPRDAEELEVIAAILTDSYRFATGQLGEETR